MPPVHRSNETPVPVAIQTGAAAVRAPLPGLIPPSGSRQPAEERRFGVLLVDDSSQHRAPLLRALRKHGYHVLHAAGGPAGESLSSESPHQIDALVACADMKRMCGLELARRVARWCPEARVLLMRRHLEESEQARRAFERGYAVIEDPFTPEQLCRRLSELLVSPRNIACAEALQADDRHLITPGAEVAATGFKQQN